MHLGKIQPGVRSLGVLAEHGRLVLARPPGHAGRARAQLQLRVHDVARARVGAARHLVGGRSHLPGVWGGMLKGRTEEESDQIQFVGDVKGPGLVTGLKYVGD